MGPPPERPGNDMGRLDTPLRKLRDNAADFLRRPVDEGWLCFRIIDGGGFWEGWGFGLRRVVCNLGNAAISRRKSLCPPRQERGSVLSTPSSFLLGSKQYPFPPPIPSPSTRAVS